MKHLAIVGAVVVVVVVGVVVGLLLSNKGVEGMEQRGPFPKVGNINTLGAPSILNYSYQKCMSKASNENKRKACENAYVKNLKEMHAKATYLPSA